MPAWGAEGRFGKKCQGSREKQPLGILRLVSGTCSSGRSITVPQQTCASTGSEGKSLTAGRLCRFGLRTKIAACKNTAVSAMTRRSKNDCHQASRPRPGGKRYHGRSVIFANSGTQERGGARHCGGRPKPSIGSAHSATSSDAKKYSHASTSTIVTRVRGAAIA